MEIHEPTFIRIRNNPTGVENTGVPWRLLSEVDAVNQEVEFTNLDPQKQYLIALYRVTGDANQRLLQMRISTDNGATFLSSSNYFHWVRSIDENASGLNAAVGQTQFDLIDDTAGLLLGNAAGEFLSGYIWITGMGKNSNQFFTAQWDFSLVTDSAQVGMVLGNGTFEIAASVNAIQFLASAGVGSLNGNFRLYELIR